MKAAKPASTWSGRDSSGHIDSKKDLAGRFCRKPFDSLAIHQKSVSPCCLNWLKIRTRIGYGENNGLMEVWNSEPLVRIRRSILDGTFEFCNHAACHLIQNDDLPKKENVTDSKLKDIIDNNRVIMREPPRNFVLSYDRSCNLSCPSCRMKKIDHRDGPVFDVSKAVQEQFVKNILTRPSEACFHIKVTGSGDAIGSKLFRDLLCSIDGSLFPNMGLTLHTNGVLLTPKWWRRLHRIHANIRDIEISVDAATPETYEVLRRGGNWQTLLRNVEALCKDNAPVTMGLVVQKRNYREMPEFVRLGRNLGVRRIKFALVLDWNTWDKDEYEDHCIWKKYHPEFELFLSVLQDPVFDEARILWTNLASYRKLAQSLCGSRKPGVSEAGELPA